MNMNLISNMYYSTTYYYNICLTIVTGVVVTGVVVLRVVVTGVVVARVVVLRVLIVSTVTATVVTPSSPQEVTKTKEPDPRLSFPWSLSPSPPPATVAAIVASKQSKQPRVGVPLLCLSPPSPAGVVVTTIESTSQDGSTQESCSYSQDAAVNKLIASADESCDPSSACL